jgi:tRNA threonylcarbamoyladenosine biosynthesis protein TsaB
MKGLVAASGKPLVGVSTVDVLARQAGTALALICSVIDARKNEVYFSRYRLRDEVLTNEFAPQALPIEKAIQDIVEPCMFIGDGALSYRNTISDKLGRAAYFAPAYQHTIRASTVASLSMERFLKGEFDAVETFVPSYIRRSDAELNVNTSVRKHGRM